MRKSSKKRTRPTRKLGLPPGSLVHIGEIKTDKPSITLIEFDARGVTETLFESLEASRGHHANREKMWLNVYGLHDPTVMAETPGQLFTALVLLLAYRFWDHPSVSRAAWLGGMAAAAALKHRQTAVSRLAQARARIRPRPGAIPMPGQITPRRRQRVAGETVMVCQVEGAMPMMIVDCATGRVATK